MDQQIAVSLREKLMCVNSSGKPECHFLCLRDVADASAVGVKATLEQAFTELGVTDVEEWMVCLCVDGAAVN